MGCHSDAAAAAASAACSQYNMACGTKARGARRRQCAHACEHDPCSACMHACMRPTPHPGVHRVLHVLLLVSS
eukprot:363690-Chlamydomonas_euryale.AAC.8